MQRPFRLRQRSDFQRLRAEGQTWKCPALMLSVLPNDLPHNRYGFIVGRRVGKAVQRNRLRRQLREAMRSIHARLKPGYDFVVIARSADYSYWELRDWLIQLIQRAALWIGEPS